MSNTKKIQLIEELMEVSNDIQYRARDNVHNMSMNNIKKLIKFAKKGHSLQILQKTFSLPYSYYRLLTKLDDIKPYPCLYSRDTLSINLIDQLEIVLSKNLDDFMYRTYAHQLGSRVQRRLYALLLKGINVTRDIDYTKESMNYVSNYLNAIENGYNREFSMRYLYKVTEYYHDVVAKAYSSGVNIDMLYSSENDIEATEQNVKSNGIISLKAFDVFGLDLKKYEQFFYNGLNYPPSDYAYIIKRTEEHFIPNPTEDMHPYIQYLRRINGRDIDQLNEEYKVVLKEKNPSHGYDNTPVIEFFTKCALVEIEAREGIPTAKYDQYADRLSRNAMLCILLGEDIQTYYHLNLENEIESVFVSLYTDRNINRIYEIVAMAYIYNGGRCGDLT